MEDNDKLRQKNEMTHHDEISKFTKLFYAFVLLSAAVIIFILFEKITAVNFYFIYIYLGLVVALSVILVAHTLINKHWPK